MVFQKLHTRIVRISEQERFQRQCSRKPWLPVLFLIQPGLGQSQHLSQKLCLSATVFSSYCFFQPLPHVALWPQKHQSTNIMFNDTWSNWRTQIHPPHGILIFAASGCEVSRCLANTLPPAIPHLLPSQSSSDIYINMTHWESELNAFAFDSSSLEDNC